MSGRLIISIHYVSKFMLCITLDRIMCNMICYSSLILFYEEMSIFTYTCAAKRHASFEHE